MHHSQLAMKKDWLSEIAEFSIYVFEHG